LHWYGVFIVGGAVVAAWISSLYAARAEDDPDHIWNLLAWSLLVGIIGARLYHVFSSPADGLGWAYYRENPLDIIKFWDGGFQGLGIYGGLIGGTLAVIGYCWYNKLNPIRYLDYIAPNVLVAQALGRMGNFVNQELYGPPTSLPWAFHINPRFTCQLPPNLPPDVQYCGAAELTETTIQWYATHGFHPTFFYEALWNLAMFVLLAFVLWRYGQRLRRGDATILYLVAYSTGRFWVELFRPDAWVIGQLATAQWTALLIVVGGIVALIVRHAGWSWQEHPGESLAHMSALAGAQDESGEREQAEPVSVDTHSADYAAGEGGVQAQDSVPRPDQRG
jgi:phosphatidylglycerol:prolipoprotein diacylglycerol transferase